MKKRWISTILTICIVFTLTACSSASEKEEVPNAGVNANGGVSNEDTNKSGDAKNEDSDNEEQNKEGTQSEIIKELVNITIWHDKEEAVVAVLQEKLDTLTPEVVVTLEKKDGLTDSLKLVGNDAKSAPDMFIFAHDKVGLYAEMGILAPITDFLPTETFANYIDVTRSAVTYKDVIYQLPIYYETLLFMYNKDFMSEDEVPTTTEELYTYMKENTKDGRYGFVEQHSTAYYSVGWIHGFHGYIINSDGEPGLNTPETIKALNYHLKFLEFMPGESEYATVNTLFTQGLADATIGGPWLVPSAREAGINLGFANMPLVDETNQALAPYTGVQGIHVLKVAAEKKADAIQRILEALTEADIGISMANASGCAPANKACYEEPSVSKDEMVMAMKKTAESAVPMPNVPQMDIMWTVAGKLLVDINLSKKEPTETANAAQSNALALVEAMK